MNKRPTLTLSKFKNKPLENSDTLDLKNKVGSIELEDTKDSTKTLDKLEDEVLVKSDKLEKLDNSTNEIASSLKDTDKHGIDTRSSNKPKGKQESHIVESNNKEMKPLLQVNKFGISDNDYETILKYLRQHYPKCFPINYDSLVPLAVGIHKELFNVPGLPFPKIQLRRFFMRYTRQRAYRNILIVGHDRINLDGTTTSKVLKTEVDRAEWQELEAARPKVDKATHDLLIKKALENPSIAQEFLELYLPEEYKDLLDLTTVCPEKETYIEDSLKSKLSDMVFSVQMKANEKTDKKEQRQQDNEQQNQTEIENKEDRSALVYCMIEHQSSSDYWIALRLLKYSLLLLERHAVKRDKLPIIIPLVLYNGKKGYSAPRNIFELFTHPELARKIMTEDYKLIDLQAMSNDSINYDKHLSFLLYVMKHIHDRDMLSMLKVAMERCNKAIVIDQEQNYVLTRLILWYTDSKVELDKKQALEQLIMDNLPKEDTGNIMKTIAQSYIDEGYNKGINQGREEGEIKGIERGIEKGIEKAALNMLSQNLDSGLISQYTGLTVEQISKLKNSIKDDKSTIH
jgi:predicted transposase/invertase (TIGR01784 family)